LLLFIHSHPKSKEFFFDCKLELTLCLWFDQISDFLHPISIKLKSTVISCLITGFPWYFHWNIKNLTNKPNTFIWFQSIDWSSMM